MARTPTCQLEISAALYRATRAWCEREQLGMQAWVESLLWVAVQTAHEEGLCAPVAPRPRLRVVSSRDAS